MEIKYNRSYRGQIVTKCPHGMNFKGYITKCGSAKCRNVCIYFGKIDRINRTVICNHPGGEKNG